jgi:outer membrane biosynthesis protein TonB
MAISMHNPYDAPERQNKNILLSVILLSLFAHALVFVLILLANIFTPMLQLAPDKTNPTINITLAPPPPPKTMFIPTTPQPNTPHKVQPVESANDTELQSQSKVARDTTSIMPDVQGKPHADSLNNSPSVQAPQKPEVSTTQPTPKQETPQKPTPPHPNPAKAQTPPQPPQPPAKPTPPPPKPTVKPQPQVDDNGLPLLPMINAPTLAPPNSAAPQAAPRPSQPQLAQSVHGNLGRNGDSSPAAMATALGRYKQKVYQAVGSRWYPKIDKSFQIISTVSVHVQFTIHSDGTVDTKVLDAGDNSAQTLLSISVNSIREAAPFDQFTPEMIKELIAQQGGDGSSYTDDFTFSVY